MQFWNTIKKTSLFALFFLSYGCNTTNIFSHPDIRLYNATTDSNSKNGNEKIIDVSNEKNYPKGGNIKDKLEIDYYTFSNRYLAYFFKETADRKNIDLQDSTLRNYSLTTFPELYDVFVRQGMFRDENLATRYEHDFEQQMYSETRTLAAKAVKEAFQDLNVYNNIKEYLEFGFRHDKVPFTNKDVTDTNTTISRFVDDFDERVINPQKIIMTKNPTWDWLFKKLTDATIGINMNFTMPKKISDIKNMGIQPYLKWADIIRWTYSTADHTIEHKISMSIYDIGFGFTANTNETCTQLQEMDASFTRAFDKKIAIRLSGYYKFDQEYASRNDRGISFDFFLKF